MKITKIQLRRIIQEEKAKLLKEDDSANAKNELEFAVDNYIKARAMNGELDPSTIHREIVAIADRFLQDATVYGEIDPRNYGG